MSVSTSFADPLRSRSTAFAALGCLILAAWGCGSDAAAQKKIEMKDINAGKPNVTSERKEDTYLEKYDLDGDGKTEVTRYYELTEKDDESGKREKQLVKKKVDVDYDGRVDLIRVYNKKGALEREKVDLNRDGTFDLVNHFRANSQLARKEILSKKGERTVATRFYRGDNLTKVKRDSDGDGKVDYWEFYQDGELQRIGYDENGDEKVDRWVHTETKVATGGDVPSPEAPEEK